MRKLRKEYVGGEWFTVQHRTVAMRKSQFDAWRTAEIDRDDLYRKYKEPSCIKLAIWHDWVDWAERCISAPYIQVRSANCNFFTIGGLISIGATWYYIIITKSHNYLYPIVVTDDNLF